MADLSTLANLAEIFGLVTVIGALVFAVVQIRQASRLREESSSLRYITSFIQQPDALESIRVVGDLPHGWENDSTYVGDRAVLAHVDRLHAFFDVSGLMVFLGALRLDHAIQQQGDALVALWQKLKPFALRERERLGRPGPFEWTQWLYDRVRERASTGPNLGAFERYADWRP